MKIGTITCVRSNEVCARVGCLGAFYNRSGSFAVYDEDTVLAAMMTCNGCTRDNPKQPEEDPGILEKIERLQKEKIEVMHAGACRLHGGKECPRLARICDMIEKAGIRVVRGTHAE